MKLSMRALVVAAVLAPALALAQPKTADEWYKEGETQYNLGDFDKAAEAFKQGFQTQKIGYASAIAVFFFLAVTAVALIQRRVLKNEGER